MSGRARVAGLRVSEVLRLRPGAERGIEPSRELSAFSVWLEVSDPAKVRSPESWLSLVLR